MADRDHNRSNNTGTGAKALDRDKDLATPSQSGSSGGDLAREVGQRDENKALFDEAGEGQDPQVTAVRKGDKAEDGDEPNLPNRTSTGGEAKVPPRRT